jgi:hypothetical protein
VTQFEPRERLFGSVVWRAARTQCELPKACWALVKVLERSLHRNLQTLALPTSAAWQQRQQQTAYVMLMVSQAQEGLLQRMPCAKGCGVHVSHLKY